MHVASTSLEGPCAFRLVARRAFEETVVEGGCRRVKSFFLLTTLHVSEVRVVFKNGGRFLGKTAKGFIAADLMLGGHLESANGADLAIILDGVYHEGQSVELC